MAGIQKTLGELKSFIFETDIFEKLAEKELDELTDDKNLIKVAVALVEGNQTALEALLK
jgi:hypothetical protein